jgi:hypothetical protein
MSFACSAVQGFYNQQLLTAEFAKKIRRGHGEELREWLLEFLCDLCGFLCVLCGSRLLPGNNEQLLTAEFAKKIRRGRGEGLREWLLEFLWDLCGFLCVLCGSSFYQGPTNSF